jgi:dTDP-4-dehydrorhamnose reductase
MRKLLVTGISSFLGKELALFPQEEWKITGLYHKKEVEYPNINCFSCDITNEEKLIQIFNKIQPVAVIHLAALSNPNFCELHPEASFKVNVEASAQFSKLCEEKQIPLVFTSTDLVFDGENAPYVETDILKPIMVYGKHKAEAEKQILQLNHKAIIARLPVIFGNGGFMENWVKTLKEGRTVSAFTDEYRSMISATSAIEGLFLLLNQKARGIWNLGGKESISRYDFAIKMVKAFNLPFEKVIPSLRKEVKMPAARPADVSMDSRKAYQIGFNPPEIDKALEKINFNPHFKLN